MDIFDSWLAKCPISHRGLHNEELPENSLGAFQKAIELGFPIEMDVRLTDDETVIVFHDDSLKRMTNSDGYVCNLKTEDLKNLHLKNTEFTIPRFDEFLDFVGGRVPILIEIKNTGKVGILEKNVLNCLKGYTGDFAVQSFNPYSVEYFKINSPAIIRGQLSCYFKNENLARIKKFILKRMLLNKVSKPDFIAYEHINLPNRYVDRYSDLPVMAWTIRSNSDYQKVKPHCTNIIFEGFVPERLTD